MTRQVNQGLAVYAGSFDPVTYGHIDVMERSSKLFQSVVVALGVHPTRSPLFPLDERLKLLAEVAQPYTNVTVKSFDGLLIDFCRTLGARVIVRGLRAATDFEYELQIAHANADLSARDRHHLPAHAHQLRFRIGFAGARDRRARRRRFSLRPHPASSRPLAAKYKRKK